MPQKRAYGVTEIARGINCISATQGSSIVPLVLTAHQRQFIRRWYDRIHFGQTRVVGVRSMGKFDNQLAHWREQHRIAVEDLEALQSGERKMAEDKVG